MLVIVHMCEQGKKDVKQDIPSDTKLRRLIVERILMSGNLDFIWRILIFNFGILGTPLERNVGTFEIAIGML